MIDIMKKCTHLKFCHTCIYHNFQVEGRPGQYQIGKSLKDIPKNVSLIITVVELYIREDIHEGNIECFSSEAHISKHFILRDKHRNNQTKGPMIVNDEPTAPWYEVGVDLFYLKGKDYLVVIDFYSNFPDMELL